MQSEVLSVKLPSFPSVYYHSLHFIPFLLLSVLELPLLDSI